MSGTAARPTTSDATPRPPAPVVVTVLVAAGGAVAALVAALLSLAVGLRASQAVFGLLWLAAGAAALAVSSVRRDRWPWGTVVVLSCAGAFIGFVVATVQLAHRDRTAAAVAAGVMLVALLAAAGFLRRPTRDWFGYACPGCGALRWPMKSEAARAACVSCGAPAPVPAIGWALPRWLGPAAYTGWAATSLLVLVGEARERRAQRADLASSHANVRIVDWKGYAEAVAALADVTGARPVALEPGTCARTEIPEREARGFVLDGDLAERVLAGSHVEFLEGGVYLFRCERGHASGRRMDVLAVMDTTDPRVVIRRLGTGAPGRGVSPDDVVAFVEALALEVPLEVTEVGVDYVAAKLDGVPEDPLPLAERILAVAPSVGRLVGASALAEELRLGGGVYLWWPDAPVAKDGTGR